MTSFEKGMLDVRICDAVEKATNTETYREFIRNTEEEFGMEPKELDSMDRQEIETYLDFLDDLWTK